jgi:thymidylate synthase
MYGWQWRHFGAEYVNCGTDYTGQGIDQLQAVIRDLKSDPFSRRIGMTAYNVADLEKGVLHPCHGIFVQFYVEGTPGEARPRRLSCHMYQRSMDTFLGAPFNIASYAALTHLLAAICDMEPADLIISTGDTHIYKDHVQVMALQISRAPFPPHQRPPAAPQGERSRQGDRPGGHHRGGLRAVGLHPPPAHLWPYERIDSLSHP